MYKFLTVLAAFIPTMLTAEISLPEIFSDHMVLQQGKTANIWGWADKNEKVQITGSWNNQTVETTSENGKWKVELPVPSAGGPYELTVKGTNTITYKNVMIGEVWICSGRSNMEWGVNCFSDTQNDRNNANHPNIRLFMVNRALSTTPKKTFGNGETWKVCTPETVSEGGFNGFSATAFYFARHLQEKLQVPVGVIQSAWGGTIAEAWTPKSSLKKLGRYNRMIKQIEKMELSPDQITKINSDRLTDWETKVVQSDIGLKEKWFENTTKFDSWEKTKVPEVWSGKLKNFDGVVWYKRNLTIPKDWLNKELTIEMTAIDDEDITWFNGVKVGENKNWNALRKYIIPASTNSFENATITIRVYDLVGHGGFAGSAEQMKIYPTSQADKALNIAGDWNYKETVSASDIPEKPELIQLHQNMATVLYNGMITPLLPMSFRGVTWYQGESNAPDAKNYQSLFTEMISAWRNHFSVGDFPFYYVQIAPFNYRNPAQFAIGVQEAQRRTLSVKNTGMAVTNDIGNIHDIHPVNKSEVGRRLSLWALNKTYNKEVSYSGPLFRNITIDGNKVICHFDYAEGLIAPKGLNGFQIAGGDGKFVKANAEIVNDTVVLSSPEVANPVAANYAWSNTAEGELFNKHELPASTFSTNWNK